jgi:hypothetical protein
MNVGHVNGEGNSERNGDTGDDGPGTARSSGNISNLADEIGQHL